MAELVHWDLMLERSTGSGGGESVLETYRLEMGPEKLMQLHQSTTPAVRIFDHPVKFLSYEGAVNQGKGTVRIADAGTYRLLSESESYRELQLDGEVLSGRFDLVNIEGDKWEFCQFG